MPEFEEIRRFLEKRFEQFAKTVEDPEQFRREFKNLQSDWQNKEDRAVMLNQTLRVMSKYPPVWNALIDGKLVPEEQRPPESQEIIDEREEKQPAIPQKTENITMKEQPLPPSTLDSLAVWDKKIATGKEIVTGIMGILIVLVTLFVTLIAIFSVKNNSEVMASVKDVLLFLNGLVGVVLGYYFGRVPGEVRADKAESEAKTVRSKLDRTVAEVRALVEKSDVDIERGVLPENGVTLTKTQLARLRDILRQP